LESFAIDVADRIEGKWPGSFSMNLSDLIAIIIQFPNIS
jgi:hypothetical protein